MTRSPTPPDGRRPGARRPAAGPEPQGPSLPVPGPMPGSFPPVPSSVAIQKQELESSPLSRPEYFFAVSHFYRGEVDRANVWRLRIDSTTNWAVVAAATFCAYTLSHPETPHVIALFGNLVVLALLWIEVRRFRVFDVFRARVRKIEENFFAPILRRDLASRSMRWGLHMADDLLHPEFRNTIFEVMGMRLRRNYLFLFLTLLFCWIVKVWVLHERPDETLLERITILGIPPWLVLSTLALFYLSLFALLFATRGQKSTEPDSDWGTGREVEPFDV